MLLHEAVEQRLPAGAPHLLEHERLEVVQTVFNRRGVNRNRLRSGSLGQSPGACSYFEAAAGPRPNRTYVLNRIGAKDLEIRHQGHPDIVANLSGRLARFEVEITSIGDRYHTIKADDLASLKPVLDGDAGFLAILDASHPVRWAVIEYGRIRKRLGRWPLATLHAIADPDLSKSVRRRILRNGG
jgi:hypothetical protein